MTNKMTEFLKIDIAPNYSLFGVIKTLHKITCVRYGLFFVLFYLLFVLLLVIPGLTIIGWVGLIWMVGIAGLLVKFISGNLVGVDRFFDQADALVFPTPYGIICAAIVWFIIGLLVGLLKSIIFKK